MKKLQICQRYVAEEQLVLHMQDTKTINMFINYLKSG
jgi:hypothetical protein